MTAPSSPAAYGIADRLGLIAYLAVMGTPGASLWDALWAHPDGDGGPRFGALPGYGTPECERTVPRPGMNEDPPVPKVDLLVAAEAKRAKESVLA